MNLPESQKAATYQVLTAIGTMLIGIAENQDGFIRNSIGQIAIASRINTETTLNCLHDLSNIIIALSEMVYNDDKRKPTIDVSPLFDNSVQDGERS